MKKEEVDAQKARSWRSNLHFRFDNTAMPRILPYLNVTKNEIATKVMHSRNAERAIKVMNGASTDMQDMLTFCRHCSIDLAQLLLLPNGKHPVIITEEEYDRLKKSSNSSSENEELGVRNEELLPHGATDNSSAFCETKALTPNSSLPVEVPEVHIDNQNAASLINNARESAQKIHSLYERIIELTAENARMKATLSRYDLQTAMVRPTGMVQDGSTAIK